MGGLTRPEKAIQKEYEQSIAKLTEELYEQLHPYPIEDASDRSSEKEED